MSHPSWNLVGDTSVEWHCSVTTGAASSPSYNLYATRKDASGLLFHITVDAAQADRLLEALGGTLEFIEDSQRDAYGKTRQ